MIYFASHLNYPALCVSFSHQSPRGICVCLIDHHSIIYVYFRSNGSKKPNEMVVYNKTSGLLLLVFFSHLGTCHFKYIINNLLCNRTIAIMLFWKFQSNHEIIAKMYTRKPLIKIKPLSMNY